jgi:hypothetical protein
MDPAEENPMSPASLQPSSSRRATCLGLILTAPLFLMGADGNGCSSGVVRSTGDAATPSASDGATSDDAASDDAGTACTLADCAGLAAPALAKVCPGGTTVSESVCTGLPGHCGWDFPACPLVDASEPVVCNCPNEPTPVTCPGGAKQTVTHGAGPCYCPELVACPESDAAAPVSDGGGSACATDADCTSGYRCGFPTADACTATGSCFPVENVECLVYEAGCACDGTEVSIACNGLPGGYSPKPLRHTGACTDGG